MKNFVITEKQMEEVLQVLLEMQAKHSFNVLNMLGTLPEVKLDPVKEIKEEVK